MATLDDFYAELNKLNKNKLIEIIFNKSVSDSITMSESIRKHINVWSEDGLHGSSGDSSQLNLETSIQFVKLKSELEILKTKLDASSEKTSCLMEVIENQKCIIELQKSMMNVNKTNTREMKGDVAVTTENSEILSGKPRKMRQAEEKSRMPNTGKTQVSKSDLRRESIIMGTESSTTFVSSQRKAWIYVGRANVDTKEETVHSYLKSKFPTRQFTVEKLPQRENAHSSSFRVSADINMTDELYKCENWPENIVVKRYRFFRGTKENKGK